jgi:hypothetical protein
MDIREKIIRATQHLVLINPKSRIPEYVGSGCIINYQSKLYLITVEHVTNVKGLGTCIETGYTIPEVGSKLYSVGGMMLCKSGSINNTNDFQKLLEILDDKNKFDELKNLDIAYVELKEKFDIYQKQIDFENYTIKESKKIIIETNLSKTPNINETYYCFGRIHSNLNGKFLISQEKLVANLKFKCEEGNYRVFSLSQPIIKANEFEGMSGAPVMDSKGNIVAFIAHGFEGSPDIYCFSTTILKSMLEIEILENNK